MSGFLKIEMSASGSGVAETWTMTTKELDRATVVARLIEGTLTQLAAPEALGISPRQVRRLQRGYEVDDAKALVSKRRGRPSNRRLPQPTRVLAIDSFRERYVDFGPTLAREKLSELARGPRVRRDAARLNDGRRTVDEACGASPSAATTTRSRRLYRRARSDRRLRP